MEEKGHDIELRSEEFSEILGWIPPWILRWGMTMTALIIISLLIGSAVFKYPDIITSTVTLTGTIPVSGVVARSSGKIQELYVQNNQQVKKNAILAVLENSAKTEDVLKLKGIIQEIDSDLDAITLIPYQQLQLGNLQSIYSSFYLAISEYTQFKKIAYHLKKIDLGKERILRNEIYYRNMLRQKEASTEQVKIFHQQYVRDSLLGEKKLLSKEEIEKSYTQYLQSFLSAENMDRLLENLQIQLVQIYESLYDTEYQYQDKKNALETRLRSLISQLKTEINDWEMDYALITPINGKITFSQYWTKNQNVISGDIVFSIVPNIQGQIIGKALLPTDRSGKVKVGQRVNIRFSNYPDNEYGIVRGYVQNVSLIPAKSSREGIKSYTVDICLPDGLITTYKKKLPFQPEMEGQADIITEDMTLLERFILPLKKVVTESL